MIEKFSQDIELCSHCEIKSFVMFSSFHFGKHTICESLSFVSFYFLCVNRRWAKYRRKSRTFSFCLFAEKWHVGKLLLMCSHAFLFQFLLSKGEQNIQYCQLFHHHRLQFYVQRKGSERKKKNKKRFLFENWKVSTNKHWNISSKRDILITGWKRRVVYIKWVKETKKQVSLKSMERNIKWRRERKIDERESTQEKSQHETFMPKEKLELKEEKKI